jgi:hypothetical protein
MNLKTKKLLNEAVTGETKRCLAILKRLVISDELYDQVKDDIIDNLYKQLITEIIEGSPYIEFNKELLKRIPK